MMKHRYLLLALIVGSALFPAVEALANSSATPDNGVAKTLAINLGERDFRSYCAACHGVGAMGDGTIAEFLTIAAPDLTMLKKINVGQFPRERIVELIDGRAEVKVHGNRDMPVWGDWFDVEAISPDTDVKIREIIVRERIDALVNYIESLQVN